MCWETKIGNDKLHHNNEVIFTEINIKNFENWPWKRSEEILNSVPYLTKPTPPPVVLVDDLETGQKLAVRSRTSRLFWSTLQNGDAAVSRFVETDKIQRERFYEKPGKCNRACDWSAPSITWLPRSVVIGRESARNIQACNKVSDWLFWFWRQVQYYSFSAPVFF